MIEIGKKIRILRKAKKMSLVELSKSSEVALATLSRIETGRMVGTLESHMNIAKTLGITLSQLYADVETPAKEVVFMPGRAHTETFFHGKNVLYEMLTTNLLSKKMMPVLLNISAGSKSNIEQAPKDTEKFIYCIDGKLEISVAGKSYVLNKLDTLYFDASAKHYITNIGKKDAQAICITTPPIL